jgi:YD repeat-containing protein
MPGNVRRIVTGVNAAGRSCIVSDTRFPAAAVAPGEAVRVGLWTTASAPASNTTPDPVPDGVIMRTPPAHRGGTVVRITDIQPDAAHAYAPDELGRRGCKTTPDRSARHPGFHATDTVDYAICLEGEVWAVLDEDETLMRAGDVLIQRGTYHAWANRSDRICRMAFILIDAAPLDDH